MNDNTAASLPPDEITAEAVAPAAPVVDDTKYTTAEMRKKYALSRSDAVSIPASERTHDGIVAYKNSDKFVKRAERRAKQGNGLENPPRLCGWKSKDEKLSRISFGGAKDASQATNLLTTSIDELALGLVIAMASGRVSNDPASSAAKKSKFPPQKDAKASKAGKSPRKPSTKTAHF
jgi:hypothetical protein